MKRFLAVALGLLVSLLPVALLAADNNGLPTGQAIETGTPVSTEDWPYTNVTGWCVPGATCVGTLYVEANTCPQCPFITMQSFTPAIPDASGTVKDVYLEPRMYSYRCRIGGDYSAGIFACRVQTIK